MIAELNCAETSSSGRNLEKSQEAFFVNNQEVLNLNLIENFL